MHIHTNVFGMNVLPGAMAWADDSEVSDPEPGSSENSSWGRRASGGGSSIWSTKLKHRTVSWLGTRMVFSKRYVPKGFNDCYLDNLSYWPLKLASGKLLRIFVLINNHAVELWQHIKLVSKQGQSVRYTLYLLAETNEQLLFPDKLCLSLDSSTDVINLSSSVWQSDIIYPCLGGPGEPNTSLLVYPWFPYQ